MSAAAVAVPPSVLRDALQRCAVGFFPETSAVAVLLSRPVLLGREEFLAQCVDLEEQGWTPDGSAALAEVDWFAAAGYAETLTAAGADPVDVALLRIAVSLGAGDLGAVLAGLDHQGLTAVLTALTQAVGLSPGTPTSAAVDRERS